MKPITVKINRQGIIKPANEYELRYMMEKAVFDTAYRCKLYLPRSLKSLGLYWLIMSALEFHLGATEEYWHNYFKNIFLEKKEVKNIFTGQIELYTLSTDFESMSEDEYKNYLGNVINALSEKGIDYEELINNGKGQQI